MDRKDLKVKVVGDRPLIREVEGGVIVQAPCAARMTSSATLFIPSELFDRVVVYGRGFNARWPATIKGSAVAWSYADGHGMMLVAVLKRGESFTLWVPGHHDHGPGYTYEGHVTLEGEVVLREKPPHTMRRLEL